MMSKLLAALPRVLLGLVFFVFGMAGLLQLIPHQEMEGAAAVYMAGLGGTYLITLVKLTEVVVGLLLLSNRFVPLALTLLAPVMVNIVGFHLFYAPSGLAMPVVLLALQLFLAWKYRAAFAPMLSAKHQLPVEPKRALSSSPAQSSPA